MTVPTEVSRVTYAGNDVTTDFSTGFYFLAASDVKVTLDTGVSILAKVEGIDYALSVPLAGSGAAGTVEMYTPPRPGQTLIIVRDVPLTQDTSFRSQGSFSPSVHEDAMDRLMFAIQELDRRTGDLESAGAPGSVIAGDGVSFTSTTLNVGAGNGIQVNPDTVEVLYGSVGSMVAVAKSSAAAGVANTAARIDHKHDITTAAPAAGAVLVGNAAAEGSATTLARSDHTHALAAPAAPANVTKSAADAGAATSVARADHKHDVSTASAIDVTDSSNAEGSATTLARSDHTHAHGARGGGTLHAVATTSVAGFLSAADKTKLDNLGVSNDFGGSGSEVVVSGGVKTTNATPTTILSWTPTNQSGEAVELIVAVKQDAAASGGAYGRAFCVTRFDGSTTQVGATQNRWTDIESTAGWDVTVSVASPAVNVVVTGAVGTSLQWFAMARRVRILSA